MTIFLGVPWAELDAQHVQDYLAQADDEPLLWEAKGTELDKKEVRRQVCAFANGHEVGYIILGANKPKGASTWDFDGLLFPGAEPMTWVSDVIADLEVGVRPRPDFDVRSWPTRESKHLAVVKVTPVSTPPCIANGTVYERLPGKTQVVKDPLMLAGLFSRGDETRRNAQASADTAALRVMEDWLGTDAGLFRGERERLIAERAEAEAAARDQGDEPQNDGPDGENPEFIRFAVGVAATGNPPDVSSRLFRASFAQSIWELLREGTDGWPQGYAFTPDRPWWSQEALTWRHEVSGPVDFVRIVRAAWDGSAATGQRLLTEDAYIREFASSRVKSEWALADDLVERLGGFGDVYVTVLVAGGKFPRRRPSESPYIIMRRGPVLPGVDDEHLASMGRELLRSVGYEGNEPEEPS